MVLTWASPDRSVFSLAFASQWRWRFVVGVYGVIRDRLHQPEKLDDDSRPV